MTYKLLIVDDEAANIRLLERLFREDYSCLTASSGEEAMTLLDQHEVAVIISDQRMPQMSGIELLKRSAARRPHMVRILLTGYTDLEALVEAVNCGLVYMYVSKPWNNDDLKLRVSRAVENYENNKRQHSLTATNERLTARLKEMRVGLVRAIAAVLQVKDPYLALHAVRVSKYAELLGERFNLNEDLLADMTAASFLHDLDAVAADEIYSGVQELKEIAHMIRCHYENFDGSGSPLGLIGEQIPLAVRLLRVAKEFDLMTNPRVEDEALTHENAIQRLQRGSGKEFDPVVVQRFSDVASELKSVIPTGLSEIQFSGMRIM